jgi:hypothetical protein
VREKPPIHHRPVIFSKFQDDFTKVYLFCWDYLPKKNWNVIPQVTRSHLSKERLFGPGAGFQVAESEALKDFGSSFGDLADLVQSGSGWTAIY